MLDFDFPVFRAHPFSNGPTFGELTPSMREAYLEALRGGVQRALAAFQPDVVHVHHGWALAGILAELDQPYVVTLHGTEHTAFLAFPAFRDLALRGLHGARMVTAVGGAVRDDALRSYGLADDRVEVIPNGVDTTLFSPRTLEPSALPPTTRPIVLFGGRLIPLKGVDVLLRAARLYGGGTEGPVTVIAGSGEERAPLERLARDLGLDAVHIVGQQGHEAMAALVNAADVVVVPSREDSLPLMVLEALACGTPVVASRVGALEQVVQPGVGWLVEPEDEHALAQAVRDTLQSGLKRRAATHIAAYARGTWSFDRLTELMERVYARATAQYGRPGTETPLTPLSL
jgi:glycosyltransferase involved in cell wall biosynthesis